MLPVLSSRAAACWAGVNAGKIPVVRRWWAVPYRACHCALSSASRWASVNAAKAVRLGRCRSVKTAFGHSRQPHAATGQPSPGVRANGEAWKPEQDARKTSCSPLAAACC